IIATPDPLTPRITPAFLEYAQACGFHIDPARVRHPRDKGEDSYCTSLAAGGRSYRRLLIRALVSKLGRQIIGGDFVEILAFVRNRMRSQQSAATPQMHRGERDPVPRGKIRRREQASLQHARAAMF